MSADGPTLAVNPDIKVRLPPRLAEAVRRAARRQFRSLSDYTRQSLIEQLRRDGVLLEPGTATEEQHS
jgi:hypothetical protein